MSKPTALPCPCCGEEPKSGVLPQSGKHIYFCEDHPHIQAIGDSREEAAGKWNQQNWTNVMEDSSETDEVEQDDD